MDIDICKNLSLKREGQPRSRDVHVKKSAEKGKGLKRYGRHPCTETGTMRKSKRSRGNLDANLPFYKVERLLR